MNVEDVIIIGAGPAGISCAIQLHRYGIIPLLIEKNEIGGMLRYANFVENYPGFPEGISGVDLVNLFKKQIEKFPLKILRENVLSVKYFDQMFVVETLKEEHKSKVLVIASGTNPNTESGVDIPHELQEKVLYDIAPIIGYEKKKIAIAGAGDLAFDYSMTLGEKNEITVINRSDKIKCISALMNRIEGLNNFNYLEKTSVRKILPDEENRICVMCESNGKPVKLSADYLVFSIGRIPQIDYISKELREISDELEFNGKLFKIGDVNNLYYRQTAIAAGDGVKTAMQINDILK